MAGDSTVCAVISAISADWPEDIPKALLQALTTALRVMVLYLSVLSASRRQAHCDVPSATCVQAPTQRCK